MTSRTILEPTGDYKGIYVEWIEQWSQFVESCNWYTFWFAHFEFEWERNMAGLEATFVVLGLGFRVRWNYAVTDTVEEITEQIARLKDEIGEAR